MSIPMRIFKQFSFRSNDPIGPDRNNEDLGQTFAIRDRHRVVVRVPNRHQLRSAIPTRRHIQQARSQQAAPIGQQWRRVGADHRLTLRSRPVHEGAIWSELRMNVGQNRLRHAPGVRTGVKDAHGVGGSGHRQCLAAQANPGVVIDEVDDFHAGSVDKLPMRHVQLPALVGKLGLDALVGTAGPLVGLGNDEAPARKHPPYGGHRRWIRMALRQMPVDGLSPDVQTLAGQLLADPNDLVLQNPYLPGWRSAADTAVVEAYDRYRKEAQ